MLFVRATAMFIQVFKIYFLKSYNHLCDITMQRYEKFSDFSQNCEKSTVTASNNFVIVSDDVALALLLADRGLYQYTGFDDVGVKGIVDVFD